MTIESSQDRRAHLEAIKTRVAAGQQTREDVAWLCGIAEEYIANWERSLAMLKRRRQAARSTEWPATDARPRRPPRDRT